MNQRTYERLKQDAEDKYQRAVAAARAERDATVAALDRVWKLLQSPKPALAKPTLPSERIPVARGKLAMAVGAAIQTISPGVEFTLATVAERMRATSPDVVDNVARSSISGQLRRLADSGTLVQVVKGRGKRPSRYRLPQSPSSGKVSGG